MEKPKRCENANPQSVVVQLNYPSGGAVIPSFSGNIRLYNRIEDVVGYKLRYFNVTRSAAAEADPNTSKIKLFYSKKLSRSSVEPLYRVGYGPITTSINDVQIWQNVIGWNVQSSGDTNALKPFQVSDQYVSFISPMVLDEFDWAIGPIQGQLSLDGTTTVIVEFIIDFFTECKC